MKTKKLTTFIGLILVIAMVFSLASVVAYAEEETTDPEPIAPAANKLEAIGILSSTATNGYSSQAGDAPAYIYQETSAENEENTNKFIRITRGLTSATWGSFALKTDVVDEAGLYKLSFDARIPEDYNSNNFSVIMYGGEKNMSASIIGGNKDAVLGAMSGEANEWGFKRVVVTMNVPSSQANIKFMCNVSNGAYVDIDNISLIKQVSDTTFGETNLEGTKNHNFEGFNFETTSRVLAGGKWDPHPFYSVTADATTLITTPGEGSVVKLQKATNGEVVFIKDSYDAYEAGTYTVKLTVEAGSGFSSDYVKFTINKEGGTLASNINFDLDGIKTDGSDSVLTADFTIDAPHKAWTWFRLFYSNNNSPSENNYLIIKKIEICNADGVNLDTKGWLPDYGKDVLMSGAWASGWYTPAASYNNITIVEDGEEGNHVAKLMQNASGFISFTYAMDLTKYEAGKRYALLMDVKAGSTFATNNLGAGITRTGAARLEQIMPFEEISTTEWKTISVIFDIPEGSVLLGNLDIWLSNNINGSVDENSYLLIDNIKLVTVSDPVWSEELLVEDDTAMEDFEPTTIPTLKEVPAYDDFYAHKMIQLGDFESFAENQRFGTANETTQYWGALNVDAPGTIVKDGDNKVLRLKWDDNNTHTFSSAYVMINTDIMEDEHVYTLSFSYKLVNNPTHAKVAFISQTNKDMLCFDLDGIKKPGTYYTSGENNDVFTYTVSESELGDGWMDLKITFTTNFKFRAMTNSLRFLLYTNKNADLEMYVDNVALTLYEEECTFHEDENNDLKCDKCGAAVEPSTKPDDGNKPDNNGDKDPATTPEKPEGGLEAWAIALIVVACVLVVGGGAVGLVIFLKRRKK